MSEGTVRFIGKVTRVENEISDIEIYPDYCAGLLGIDSFSQIIVLYWFHLRNDEKNRNILRVYPKRHRKLTGVYACRSPSRPNPIGLTIVELINHDECNLTVKGLDAFEGSPIIDIKPFSPRVDLEA